ncbi:MAG: hypothetical protein JSV05_01850 [Candidatus Bathyarchaeota archaeon]|nr:MAG: hypothetical protein JSV05_01850 [Candidatus Bathyarchaeota archaeon]
MKKIKKLGTILGVKGFLCLASLIMIALSLVTYTGTITITPTIQFTIGATSDSWTVYVNDVNETRYLPGGFTEPPLNVGDPNTYAFQTVTDANQVCAIKIELTSAINNSKFSNFNITAKYWNGTAWDNETLYDAATGSTIKPYIDGLTPGDTGYLHQSTSTTRYYLIEVTYSYDLVDETDQVSVTFQYTPLPQNSF